MAATAIATVFLDRVAAHPRFTPSAVGALQPDRRPTSAGRSADLAQPARLSGDHRRRERGARPAGADRARGAHRDALAARPAAAVPQRRGPDRRRRPDLPRHHRAAQRRRRAARIGDALSHHRQPGGGGRRPHRPRGPHHARQRALRADRRARRRGADRDVGCSIWSTPTTATKNREAFRRMVADGAPFEMEKRYLKPDGGVVWVNTAVTTILDARRPAERGDRDRPRHHPGQARRADAAPVRGAAAPGGRERARVRDRLDGPRSPRHQLEHRRRRAHRLSRGRDRRPPGRHHLHRGRPPRRRARARGAPGARRGPRRRRALAPAQGRQPLLGQRRDDGDARRRAAARRSACSRSSATRPMRAPRRRRSRPAAPSWCRRWSTTARRAPRPRRRAIPRTASSPSSRTSCARR